MEQAGKERRLMPLSPAITDLEQLKSNPILAALCAWNAGAVEGAKFDRNELSIYVARASLRDACAEQVPGID
jgi:hypothetical protein